MRAFCRTARRISRGLFLWLMPIPHFAMSLTGFTKRCGSVVLPLLALCVAGCGSDQPANSGLNAPTGTASGNSDAATGSSQSGGMASNTVSSGNSSGAPAVTATAPIETDAGVTGPGGQHLFGPPLAFMPTTHGFGVNVVLDSGDPATVVLRYREDGADEWGAWIPSTQPASDLAEWQLEGLNAGTRYEYEIAAQEGTAETTLYRGSAITQRAEGESFHFALLSDSHIGYNFAFSNQGNPTVLAEIADQIGESNPDFFMNLGDLLDYHEFGFNDPPPDSAVSRQAYVNYRSLLGKAAASAAHFGVIGNWDGENGDFSEAVIERSRSQRILYLPNPEPTTYPEGGSQHRDYYAFTWGDALFVVLNVMTYTPTSHLLSSAQSGLPDDWTLGDEQLAWLETTLKESDARWKFTFIHHTVGGNAGDDINSAYGRGGGRAAYVGEQAMVHQLLLQWGVQIFFYGHDHVFTDMVVDGVHYTSPGSSGAPWTFTTAETGYTEYWSDSGWSRVDVSRERVHVEFLSMSGTRLFEYTLPADGAPSDTDAAVDAAADSAVDAAGDGAVDAAQRDARVSLDASDSAP